MKICMKKFAFDKLLSFGICILYFNICNSTDYTRNKLISFDHWAIIQLIGSLTSDPQIFLWKSLRDHQTCPKICFRGSRYLKRGPLQGVLDFYENWEKIHKNLKYGQDPRIFGRASSVIPFRKALAIPVSGFYSKVIQLHSPMRNRPHKNEIFHNKTPSFQYL